MLKTLSSSSSTKRSPALWRALSSPARRRILDLLRDGPRTTSELAGRFPKLSRFAVMQHLRVLSRARLVLVRRQGRYRHNYLNAVPLVQVYERWVSTYAAPMAHASLALKRVAEGASERGDLQSRASSVRDRAAARIEQRGFPMSTTTTKARKSPTEFRAARVELEVRIDAPPQRVWDAMINQTSRWWRKDFYTNPRTQGFHIEPRLGGRMYEDWGNGDGLVWATVLALETPRMILLSGHLTPQFGGPAHTLFEFRLEEAGGGAGSGGGGATLVKITDNIFGNISEGLAHQMHGGWTLLFAEGLKPFVESNA